ncbi:SemiSWEET family transporter [Leuconostoc suionicum]|uniref:SemiSWEET family transporter n=1 Tax=Leuconostoc suionicum TaxID=1511761 RepID=UPI0040353055
MRNKIHDFVGSVGAIIGLLVFLAYIPQIISNLNGEKGQPWQPLVAAISCLLWVIYGFTTEPKKDYILIVPNVAGVVFGMITFFTSL